MGRKHSQPIDKRTFGNKMRITRLRKMKTGPGAFVYTGGYAVREMKPTVKMRVKREAVLDEDGAPLLDERGDVVERTVPDGPMRTKDGKPILGGPPKHKVIELDQVHLRSDDCMKGVTLKLNVPVWLDAPGLALKARLLPQFRELLGDELQEFLAEHGGELDELDEGGSDEIGDEEDEDGGAEGDEGEEVEVQAPKAKRASKAKKHAGSRKGAAKAKGASAEA